MYVCLSVCLSVCMYVCYVASVRTEPRKIFTKFNHFCSAVFLQNSAVSRKKLDLIALQKILRTEVRKVWRKCGFFNAIWPIILQQTQSKTR